MKISNVPIKPYTLSELAHLYEISTKTLKNWIDRHQESIGERIGHTYTVKQIEIIFEKLGIPERLEE